MTVVSSASAPISSERLPSDLQLRVRGGQHGGRLIRLVGNRLTIGSAPNSSLRLVASEIQPLHCLIVRGRQGSVIRHWKGDTQLNGRPFTDEWLQAGDCLRVGNVELEVVANRRATSPDGGEEHSVVPPTEEELGQPIPPAADVSTEQFQGRLQLLLEHQRQLSERERELDNRQSEFESERQQWCHEREAELAELDAREECLRTLREEIEVTRQANACDAQSRYEQWTEELERLFRQLQQTQLERDELRRIAEELSRERQTDGDPATTASETDASSDLTLQQQEMRLRTTPPAEPGNDAPRRATEPIVQPESPSSTTHDAEEFSIEAYMSQLLQRVGARPVESDAKESPRRVKQPEAAPTCVEPKPAETARAVNADPDLTPRARPLPVDLGALRDVANQTARQAIERHARHLWWQAAAGKWFVVAVATIATSGLVYWAARGKTPAGFGLFAAGLVAIVWTIQAIWLTQRAVRIRLSERRAKGKSAREVIPKSEVPRTP